jgi:hypothetical protein
MYILVSPAERAPSVTLEEPDDCRRFHVAVRGLSEDSARQALEAEGVGRLGDPAAAEIAIAAIRKLAQGRVKPDWPERFEAMLEYAGRKGWLSADGERVQGHCEWS